jgi:putative ABC transport system ATP-binding protein
LARVPVIKITNVTKKFELGAVTVDALQSVNLEIYSGEFVMFYGPSGCGKSTLMSMIASLQPPSTGKIYVRGEDITTLNDDQLATHRRTKIGMVFQAFNLITSMNVVENIALPLTFARIPKNRRMNRAENLLETVGMSEYKKHTPSELSGGQQQRIALARSLVANPWIVLADEPTGNLDSKSADEVMRLLISLNRKSKRTVILITHNPDYLVYADRIFHMRDGKIVDVEVNANARTEITKAKEPVVTKGKRAKNKNDEIAETETSAETDTASDTENASEALALPEDKKTTKKKDKIVEVESPTKTVPAPTPSDLIEEAPVDSVTEEPSATEEKEKKPTKIKPMRLGQ